MCRLLALASRAPTTLAEALGEEDLESFVELSGHHTDGWGMAWYDRAGELSVAKDVGPAHASDLLEKLSRTTDADLALLHLRLATPGLAIALENTHPFTAGSTAFAHNGAIQPFQDLDLMLTAEARSELRGTTDSERYFLALLAALERSGGIERALPDLFGRIGERYRYSALNFVVLTGERLYAVCAFNPDEEILRQDPAYYRLSYRPAADAVVVGSSGWSGCSGEDWQHLANHQALVVERHTLATRVVDLS
ncbi:MAG TPA: class II glutamine amidotransferase [Actinomycetes bacterium]|jgi:predicted glutamine amidotransferase|nr:class II glutamine amidotransferase [Actinomycetes bacterium]